MSYYDFKVGYDRHDDTWVLLEPLEVWRVREYEHDTEDRTIRIKAGLKTDYASVPRILWVIFPKSGRWKLAAVVHDWMYKTGFLGNKLGMKKARHLADLQFYREMRLLGVNFFVSTMMYWGVRIGGRKHFKIEHEDTI